LRGYADCSIFGRKEIAMSEIERLTVALPREEVESLRAAVESGEYASTGEIVRDALRLWKNYRAVRAQEVARLRKAYEEGLASGSAGPLDIERIKREARTRFEASKTKKRSRG
jgi:antitoxin ParD1/3/4